MSDLSGIRWLLFGLQLSITGVALMAVSSGSGFDAVGMGMIYFGLLCGLIGKFGPKNERDFS